MSTGTRVRPSIVKGQSMVGTLNCVSLESPLPDEQIMQHLMEHKLGKGFFLKSGNAYFAETAHFQAMYRNGLAGTSLLAEWGVVKDKIQNTISSIWDTPKLKSMLEQPLGAPIELTFEEANEIVRLAAGRRPDLPAGKELVKEVRELLGHSLLERLKKVD